jgi:thymidylate kinase
MSVFTVALVGADGAGKSTIGRRLEGVLPFRTKYLYMGDNLETANHALFTTRLIRRLRQPKPSEIRHGPPDPAPHDGLPSGWRARTYAAARSVFRLCNRLGEEWFRQIIAWSYLWRGYLVIYDRHFFADYYAHDIAPGDRRRPLSGRIHGWLLRWLYPRPDLVVCLDAPPDVLMARKGEGTPEMLERRRREYFALEDHVEAFEVVDASRPADEVLEHVVGAIRRFHDRLGLAWEAA